MMYPNAFGGTLVFHTPTKRQTKNSKEPPSPCIKDKQVGQKQQQWMKKHYWVQTFYLSSGDVVN